MYTLIIADDEIEIRNGLLKYIHWEDIGFVCLQAVGGGREAIDAIVKQQPDVALLDIRMPVVSGLDVAKYVYENKLNTIVVLLSAYRDFEYARKAMAYSVQYYAVKSARHVELLDMFHNIKETLDARSGGAEEEDGELLITSIKRYVKQNLATVTLDTTAAFLNRNPANVSLYFKRHTGILFSQYLMQERMRYAVSLLSDVRQRVNDVSETVGYATAQSFIRAFRQYYGMTPHEYRRKKTTKTEIETHETEKTPVPHQ